MFYPCMLQKELESIYMERLLWMKQLKNDPAVHKKIMQTKDAFVDNDDFDPEEAMEAAVDKRKFLIKKTFKRLYFYRRQRWWRQLNILRTFFRQ